MNTQQTTTTRFTPTPGSSRPAARRALPRRLLGVWAHPDDEAYLSAGLMGRVTDNGGHVTSATVTLGELGFADDDSRSWLDRSNHRLRELTEACAVVGVHDVRNLGFGDGQLDSTPLGLLVDAIGDLIDDVAPDVVVTFGPDGITGHPDHVVTGLATTIAAAGRPEVELLYAAHSTLFLEEHISLHRELGMYMGQEPAGTEPCDVTLAVTPVGEELFRKRLALAAHSSQTTALACQMGEQRYRKWIAVETFRHPAGDDFVRRSLAAS